MPPFDLPSFTLSELAFDIAASRLHPRVDFGHDSSQSEASSSSSASSTSTASTSTASTSTASTSSTKANDDITNLKPQKPATWLKLTAPIVKAQPKTATESIGEAKGQFGLWSPPVPEKPRRSIDKEGLWAKV